MGIADYHIDATSFDDAIALITEALGETDTAALRAQVRPVLEDGARAVAVIEMLAVIASGFATAAADATGQDVHECISRIALRDQANR